MDEMNKSSYFVYIIHVVVIGVIALLENIENSNIIFSIFEFVFYPVGLIISSLFGVYLLLLPLRYKTKKRFMFDWYGKVITSQKKIDYFFDVGASLFPSYVFLFFHMGVIYFVSDKLLEYTKGSAILSIFIFLLIVIISSFLVHLLIHKTLMKRTSR